MCRDVLAVSHEHGVAGAVAVFELVELQVGVRLLGLADEHGDAEHGAGASSTASARRGLSPRG